MVATAWRAPALTADLEALGLLPEPLPKNAENGHRQPRPGKAPPAPPEDREEFRRLMALRDVRPRTANQIEELVRCPSPNHEDRHASCSVNWLAAVFNCHACGAGGGIGTLRRLRGEDRAKAIGPRCGGDR